VQALSFSRPRMRLFRRPEVEWVKAACGLDGVWVHSPLICWGSRFFQIFPKLPDYLIPAESITTRELRCPARWPFV